MRTVTVDKSELLTILRKNRAIHETEYEDVMTGYQKEAVAECQNLLDCVMKGAKGVSLHINLREPKNSLKAYDRAIKMVEMNVTDSIELDITSFENYVEDNWDWTNTFAASKATYLK